MDGRMSALERVDRAMTNVAGLMWPLAPEFEDEMALAARYVCAIFVRGFLSSMIVVNRLLLWCWFLHKLLTTCLPKPMYRAISSRLRTYKHGTYIYRY